MPTFRFPRLSAFRGKTACIYIPPAVPFKSRSHYTSTNSLTIANCALGSMATTGGQTKPTAEMVETVDDETQLDTSAPEEHPWAVIKANPKLIFYSIISNIGPLMFGYDFVIVAAISVLGPFQYVCSSNFIYQD
jgi:hypothetical protein